MFRAFQTIANAQGVAQIDLSPYIESVEWDIYQIAVQTQNQNDVCNVEIHHNGYFLCGSSQGYKDCAFGPPDLVALPSDIVSIMWFGADVGDQCQAGIWYNENPDRTTYSAAH